MLFNIHSKECGFSNNVNWSGSDIVVIKGIEGYYMVLPGKQFQILKDDDDDDDKFEEDSTDTESDCDSDNQLIYYYVFISEYI